MRIRHLFRKLRTSCKLRTRRKPRTSRKLALWRLMGIAAALGVASASAHVLDDAVFDFRNMGVDANGDGVFQSGEGREALSLGDAASGLTGGVLNGTSGHVVWRTERVVHPYTGVSRDEQVLYFSHPIEWDDQDPQTASISPNAIVFGDYLKDLKGDYAVFARVRFDSGETYCGINKHQFLTFSYADGNAGVMLYSTGTGDADRSIGVYYGATNAVGNASPRDFTHQTKFRANQWVDVCVVAQGRTFACYVATTNSALEVTTHTMDASRVGSCPPSRHAFMILGPEDGRSTKATSITNGMKVATGWGARTKTANMSYHRVAVWGRALTEDEVREVMAEDRPEVFRVGSANGKSSEFAADRRTGDADVRGVWTNFPAALAAGDAAIFRFEPPNDGYVGVSQALRWTATAASAAGTLTATLNGRAVGTLSVQPGRTAACFVPPGCIAAGENVLSLARTDTRAGLVTLDALALGGGWQVGKADLSYWEFCEEWLNTPTFRVTDSNWKNLRRVISESNGRTNILLRFDVPRDVLKARARLVHSSRFVNWSAGIDTRDHQDYVVTLNDHVLDSGVVPASGTEVSYELPAEWVRERDNVLRWINPGTSSVSAAPYYGVDYYRLDVLRPEDGTLLILR